MFRTERVTAAYAFPQPNGLNAPQGRALAALRVAHMRLTVLGKSPAWQDAGGACSGYLVEDGDTRVLLDCGNGVFAKLRERSTTWTSTRW